MTPRQARRKAARLIAVVTMSDLEGVSYLLPVAPLRKAIYSLRTVIPSKLDRGVLFRVRAGALTLSAVERPFNANGNPAQKLQSTFATFMIPAAVAPEVLEHVPLLYLEAWRLEKLVAAHRIGERILLTHDPVSRLRKEARRLWPSVQDLVEKGAVHVVTVGTVADDKQRTMTTRSFEVGSEAEVHAALRAASVVRTGIFGWTFVINGMVCLDISHGDSDVMLFGRPGAEPRQKWRRTYNPD